MRRRPFPGDHRNDPFRQAGCGLPLGAASKKNTCRGPRCRQEIPPTARGSWGACLPSPVQPTQTQPRPRLSRVQVCRRKKLCALQARHMPRTPRSDRILSASGQTPEDLCCAAPLCRTPSERRLPSWAGPSRGSLGPSHTGPLPIACNQSPDKHSVSAISLFNLGLLGKCWLDLVLFNYDLSQNESGSVDSFNHYKNCFSVTVLTCQLQVWELPVPFCKNLFFSSFLSLKPPQINSENNIILFNVTQFSQSIYVMTPEYAYFTF